MLTEYFCLSCFLYQTASMCFIVTRLLKIHPVLTNTWSTAKQDIGQKEMLFVERFALKQDKTKKNTSKCRDLMSSGVAKEFFIGVARQ